MMKELAIYTPEGKLTKLSQATPKHTRHQVWLDFVIPACSTWELTHFPETQENLWILFKAMWKHPSPKGRFVDQVTGHAYNYAIPTEHINAQYFLEYRYLKDNGFTGLAAKLLKHLPFDPKFLSHPAAIEAAEKRAETFFVDMLNVLKDVLYEVAFDRINLTLIEEAEWKLNNLRRFYRDENISSLHEFNTTVTPAASYELLSCETSFTNEGGLAASTQNWVPHFSLYKRSFTPVINHVDDIEAQVCNAWLVEHGLAEPTADEAERRREYVIANHEAFMDSVSSLTPEEARPLVNVYVNSGLYEEWFNITRQAGEETHGQIERFGTNIQINLPETPSQYERITNYLINQPEDLVDDEFIANVRNTLRGLKR